MGNLIKMDWYRLRSSTFFLVSLIVSFVLNLAFSIGMPLLNRFFAPDAAPDAVSFSYILANPISFTILFVLMLMSLVSFSYADLANGYIKNIAGQLPNKGLTVISKFVVGAIHNCIFFVVFLASTIIGNFIVNKVVFDDQIIAAVGTFFIKFLLSLGLTAILLFVSTGLRSKTLASILGVLFGSGMLTLVYMGLNTLFQQSVDVNEYAPDSLFSQVNVSSGMLVFNAILVAVICIAVFLPLTVTVFNKRDIK